MQFTKMSTDCLTADVASSGFFFVVAAAAATEVQKKKKKMEYVDKTLDTVTASGWCLQWINN